MQHNNNQEEINWVENFIIEVNTTKIVDDDLLYNASLMVDAMAYAWADHVFKMKNEYVLMYIKKRPWYIPEFLYKWVIGKVLVRASFKNNE